MQRTTLKISALALAVSLTGAGCDSKQSPSPSPLPQSPPTVQATPSPKTVEPSTLTPKPLPPEEAQAIEQFVDLLVAKRYDEAEALCLKFPNYRVFEIFKGINGFYRRGLEDPNAAARFTEWCSPVVAYMRTPECSGEFMAAVLRGFSPTLLYPGLDIIEDRLKDGDMVVTDILIERLIQMAQGENARNALHAIEALGISQDRRAIAPIRLLYEAAKKQTDQKSDVFRKYTRGALLKLGVKDMDKPLAESGNENRR